MVKDTHQCGSVFSLHCAIEQPEQSGETHEDEDGEGILKGKAIPEMEGKEGQHQNTGSVQETCLLLYGTGQGLGGQGCVSINVITHRVKEEKSW